VNEGREGSRWRDGWVKRGGCGGGRGCLESVRERESGGIEGEFDMGQIILMWGFPMKHRK
jgi:hypothetical protein